MCKRVDFIRPSFAFLGKIVLYRFPSLYARDRDRINIVAYNKFAYKKTMDDCKLEDRF